MAVEAYELAETRGASLQDGKFSATRKFAIWDDATPLTTPASVTAVFGTTVSGIVIPDVGAIFPGEVDVFCSSYSLEVDSLTRNTWVATFSYAQSEFPFEQGPQQLGYTEFTFDYTAEFRDVYRSNPGLTFPTDGDAGTASYCNGTAISVGDQPMSVLRYFTSLEITEVVAYNTMDDRISRIIAARGKRNSSIFRGAAVGTVVYRGARATRIAPNKFSVTHSFLQDDWYHMIQVAPVGSDGRVRLDLFQGQTSAVGITWRQPFPSKADFNLISENF